MNTPAKSLTKLRTITVLVFMFTCFHLYPQGHYNGGSFNTNDYFIPPAPGWVLSLYYAYSQTEYFDDSGSKSQFSVVNQNPPLYVEVQQSVKTHSIIPMFLYFGKGKILNAHWGVLVLPMLNNPNANIALDFYTEQDTAGSSSIDINAFGLGDAYLQPIWLTWDKNKLSTTFSYGFWMPTGKYEVDGAENVGLGYWSHNFRVASRYKPTPKTSLTGALTYELNNKQKDVDFTEASHLTFDYAASYNFTMGHEVGLFGFGTWQTGEDQGENAVPLKDRIYGLGLYGSYWFVPGKFGTLGRVATNFGTRNRFGGWGFQIGLNYLIM